MGSLDRGVAVRDLAGRARDGAPSGGRVVAVHRKAVYLRIGRDLVAVVSSGVPPGPLHLRCDAVPPARTGEPVLCDGSRIAGRTWAVRCDVPTWEGMLPSAVPRLRSEEPLPPEVEVGRDRLRAAVRAGDIEAAAGLLGGRGPGLTPAGDDVLAGLLLVARAVWGPGCEERLGAAASAVPSTEPAEAFLRWAARGQSVAPAHDWLGALPAGDDAPTADPPAPDAALREAERRLTAVGASSGRCLLAGMRAGLAQLPRVEVQIARAGTGPGL